MRNKLRLYIFLLLILLQNCAASSKKDFKKVTPENYTELNGIYYNHPKQIYGKNKKRMISDSDLRTKDIYAILNFRPFKFDSIIMFEEEKRIELRFLTNQKLKVNYIVNGNIQASSILNGEIKKGFFLCRAEKFRLLGNSGVTWWVSEASA